MERPVSSPSPIIEKLDSSSIAIKTAEEGIQFQNIEASIEFTNTLSYRLNNVKITGRGSNLNIPNEPFKIASLGPSEQTRTSFNMLSRVTGNLKLTVDVTADGDKKVSQVHRLEVREPLTILDDDPIKIEFDKDPAIANEDVTATVTFTNPLEIDLTDISITADGIITDWQGAELDEIKPGKSETWKIIFTPEDRDQDSYKLNFQIEIDTEEIDYSQKAKLLVEHKPKVSGTATFEYDPFS